MTDDETTAQDIPATTEYADAGPIPATAPKKKLSPGGARMFLAMAMTAIGGMGAETLESMEAYDADRARREAQQRTPRQHHPSSHDRSRAPKPTRDADGHALDGCGGSDLGNERIRAAREKRERKAAKRAAASSATKGGSS